MPLPFRPGSAPEEAVKSAVSFMRLPTWSKGYTKCDSENSEVSCQEIVRAAEILEKWEHLVSSKKTVGYVWVNVDNKPFPDRMSMVYHGLQIAVSTNRALYVDRRKLEPFQLPKVIGERKDGMTADEVRVDHTFVCLDVSDRRPRITFQGASWPQALYIHPTIAPWLRDHFGYHAAYFLGNYLFGTVTPPETRCVSGEFEDAVEVFEYRKDTEMLTPYRFPLVLGRCGIDPGRSVFILNTDKDVPANESMRIGSSPESHVCGLRKLMSAKRIIHTFGSRLGFWATAMQGRSGGFVNPLDNICVNTSNSQQGSVWHTYCPKEKEACIYRTNSRFFVCGSDVSDIKSYVEYLLW
jgi:hypothetical protein